MTNAERNGMSKADSGDKKTPPGRASPDVAFRRAMAGVTTRCSDLTTMLDNGAFGQVEHTARSAVNLWLTARIACRRLGEHEAARNPAGDADQLLRASYEALLHVLKRAHTLGGNPETKGVIDDLRITLVAAMSHMLNES